VFTQSDHSPSSTPQPCSSSSLAIVPWSTGVSSVSWGWRRVGNHEKTGSTQANEKHRVKQTSVAVESSVVHKHLTHLERHHLIVMGAHHTVRGGLLFLGRDVRLECVLGLALNGRRLGQQRHTLCGSRSERCAQPAVSIFQRVQHGKKDQINQQHTRATKPKAKQHKNYKKSRPTQRGHHLPQGAD
jgi:hypothetical protein